LKPQDDPSFVDVCALSAVPENASVPFEANGRRLLLCNSGGEIFAIADRCTHAAWDLAGAELRAGEIVCALHGARFDVRTGEATARPASKPIDTYAVRVREGRVQVRVPRPPR
jgi:3-phenylpropionate/trans-cinnamate dioxygenase ferredoxin subunit